jgi:hypothetical protein
MTVLLFYHILFREFRGGSALLVLKLEPVPVLLKLIDWGQILSKVLFPVDIFNFSSGIKHANCIGALLSVSEIIPDRRLRT